MTRRTLQMSCLLMGLSAWPAAPALAKRADGQESARAAAKTVPEASAPRSKNAPEAAAPSADKAEKAEKKESPRARPSKLKPQAPCVTPEVRVVRKRGDEIEERKLQLTSCDGAPNPGAIDSVSVLARPRNVERPLLPEIKAYQRRPLDRGPAAKRRRAEFLSEQVMRIHPGLAVRLQRVAQRYPGKTIEIISGHRPDARDTSRHHHGRALDIRVEGVSKEALRDFLRSLDETGVGYYPNGYFVHMDVRDDRGYWVDRSGPGEAADYGTWPPRKDEIERARKDVLSRAMAELDALSEPVDADPGSSERLEAQAGRHDVKPSQVPAEPALAHEDQELTEREVDRIKADALKALEGL